MEFGLGSILGALIRWLLRGCRTNFKDELDCVDGWFSNVPILGTFENIFWRNALSLLYLLF